MDNVVMEVIMLNFL